MNRPAINKTTPIIFIGVMFFVFGFTTWINAMLIPYFKLACELTHFESYLVTFAFYISYLLMSVPASYLLTKTGFKRGMTIGFWIMAMGAFIFIPAAYGRAYPLFLCGLFFIGIGLTVLQTAANPYVTILGSKDRAAQRIGIMGICNKTAGILAPIILAAAIFKPGDEELFKNIAEMAPANKSALLDKLILRVIQPYACMGAVLFFLGVVVRYSPLPEIESFVEEKSSQATAHKSILAFPHLILGAIAIFLHVGSQVIAVDTIIGYAQSTGIALINAKVFPGFTLFATICGYLLGVILTPRFISQLNIFRVCTIIGLLFSIGILVAEKTVMLLGYQTDLSLYFIIALGFANSMIWAGIWPLALDNLGAKLKLGASILVMGLCGNALLPLAYGYLADLYSLRWGYVVLIPCYLYLIFYSFYGYRIQSWKKTSQALNA
ncbi:sugar MFS transporter [Niabella yanshanensis]|uniref:Sugar MFS transporter n=1 Tax=Niabella yanshanensis TaxID=577386 RepID=A0ABZ0W4X2_9BACT|nr:sugar MFS transporter [Niabella yanshanensis]WQD38313.1 sugar MFS transporter [Niabella yanshanensis]